MRRKSHLRPRSSRYDYAVNESHGLERRAGNRAVATETGSAPSCGTWQRKHAVSMVTLSPPEDAGTEGERGCNREREKGEREAAGSDGGREGEIGRKRRGKKESIEKRQMWGERQKEREGRRAKKEKGGGERSTICPISHQDRIRCLPGSRYWVLVRHQRAAGGSAPGPPAEAMRLREPVRPHTFTPLFG